MITSGLLVNGTTNFGSFELPEAIIFEKLNEFHFNIQIYIIA